MLIDRELEETVMNSNEGTFERALNAAMQRVFVLSVVRSLMGIGLGRRLAEGGHQTCLNGVVKRQAY
ncbi:MAG: hypothetical protein CMM55_02430 [Rhodospirillaceae bacterium]|nr:hypothetical protein [Rhodospirillaceae bacterium]